MRLPASELLQPAPLRPAPLRPWSTLLSAIPCKALLAATPGGLNIWLQVIILGVVEGLTEFLPVSSTGHLVVTSELLHFPGSIGGTFEIFIQLGAVLAVAAYYFRDLYAQACAVLGHGTIEVPTKEARRFWLHIVLAFLPAAVIGLRYHHWIKQALFHSSVIAFTLIVGGLIFIIVERLPRRLSSTQKVLQISLRQALAVGAAQTLALVPGVSRSGASIVGGLLAGLDRPTATAFSFYLALPTLGGATVVDLLRNLKLLGAGDAARLALGTMVALIVAWISIGWLLRYVSRSTFVSFGIYRLLAGGAILIMTLQHVL
jgi:undecaprenyl-diphosphatase